MNASFFIEWGIFFTIIFSRCSLSSSICSLSEIIRFNKISLFHLTGFLNLYTMKQITYLLLLVILSSNLNAQNQEFSKDQIDEIIETNFLLGEVPKRYYSNILIELRGNPTKDDSIIVQNLVNTLNPLIEKWDIYLVNEGKANNLILEINVDTTTYDFADTNFYKGRKYETIWIRRHLKELTPNLDYETRRKIIRYNLLTILLQTTSNFKLHEKIPGSVFSESSAENITFHNADFQIIEAAYATNFDNIYSNILTETPRARDIIGSKKKSNLRRNPTAPYFKKHWNIILMLVNLISTIIAVWLLTFFYQRGIFKNHHYNFAIFLKQGLIILGIALTYYLFFIAAMFLKVSAIYYSIKDTILPILVFSVFLFLGGLVSLVIIFFSERRILKNNDNLMLGVLFPLATTMVIPSFLILIIFLLLAKPTDNKEPIDVATVFITAISILSLFGLIRAIFIFLSKKSESVIHQKDVELARISELHKQAELQSLRSKINPHFLYNSLNSIASLALSDPQKTEEMALSLSDFFKYSINREQKQTNPISEELELVKTYLEIEKVRFGERLNFEIDCPKDLMTVHIPQLLIQPLVENAIKHGIAQILADGKIKVSVVAENRNIKIRVTDNGPAFPSGPLSGFGIRNTHERLALMYETKASLNWENGDEKYIEITLPFQQN